MTAKEMFEELGYDWKETNIYIQYTKYNWKHFIFRSKTTICFWKLIEKVSLYDDTCLNATIKELKAINKQIEELCWDE